jgi:hypothetical protein
MRAEVVIQKFPDGFGFFAGVSVSAMKTTLPELRVCAVDFFSLTRWLFLDGEVSDFYKNHGALCLSKGSVG